MERTEVNCQTGEIKVIQLTAEEIAALPTPVPPTYQELRAAVYPPAGEIVWATPPNEIWLKEE